MQNINEITSTELQNMLDQNKNVTLIDVRENEEVANGMIPTSKHIPLQQIPESLDQLNKDQEYIMICRSGRRSMNAAQYMKENGYNNVSNLADGMLGWDGEVVF